MPNSGMIRVDVEVESLTARGSRVLHRDVLVDPEQAISSFPAVTLEQVGLERFRKQQFQRPDGTILWRWTGGAILRVGDRATADDVVFGEPGDAMVIGFRTLSGLNLRVDPASGRLVDGGPVLAAVV